MPITPIVQSRQRVSNPVFPIHDIQSFPVPGLHHHEPDIRCRSQRVRDASASRDDGNDLCHISLWCVPPHPLASFCHARVWLTSESNSRVVSIHLRPHDPCFNSTHRVFCWKTLRNGRYLVDSIRSSSPGRFQITQQPPRSEGVQDWGLDWTNSVSVLAWSGANVLTLDYRLGSLLTIFCVECT